MRERWYKVGPRNSTVCGRPGREFDWSRACWDGSAVYEDPGRRFTPEQRKAPMPTADNYLIAANCEYIHVPWHWESQCTSYRVRPNEAMQAGETYRGHRVDRQRAVLKDGEWFWVLEEAER